MRVSIYSIRTVVDVIGARVNHRPLHNCGTCSDHVVYTSHRRYLTSTVRRFALLRSMSSAQSMISSAATVPRSRSRTCDDRITLIAWHYGCGRWTFTIRLFFSSPCSWRRDCLVHSSRSINFVFKSFWSRVVVSSLLLRQRFAIVNRFDVW